MRRIRSGKPTILQLQKVADQVLHQPVLLRHVPLEAHHLVKHVLVVDFQVSDVRRHFVLGACHAFDLVLESLYR